MKKVLVCLTASIFLLALASPSLAAEPPDYKKCAELNGVAWGLCAAAMASACDTTPSHNCDQIAKAVEKVIGQPAPTWNCPCGDSEYFIWYISAHEIPTSCDTFTNPDGAGKVLLIDTPIYHNIIFSFYPGSYPKQTCGFLNTSVYILTDDEASACISEVKTAAKYFGITCQ